MSFELAVYSDFVCPWCYVGLERLDRLVVDYDVVLRWHPFQLRPDTPEAGVNLAELMPPAALAQATERLLAVTAAAGLPYHRHERIPNTHLAHEAAWFAEAQGRGPAFHSAVMRAYFGEGRWIGDVDSLVAIAESVGLDGAALRAALVDRRYRVAVDGAIAEAAGRGIHAVPAFEFAPGEVLSGAQPYEVFEAAMAAFGVPKR